MPGELDEDLGLAEVSKHEDPRYEFARAANLRAEAGKAFLTAAASAQVRRALHARGRPLRRQYVPGEWLYYWRIKRVARRDDDEEDPDREDGSDPDDARVDEDQVSHWHGPALVVAVERKIQEEGDKTVASCVWAVHGSSLLRLLHEHCRPELQHEKEDRETNRPETADPVTPLERARELLHRVRGPVNFHDYVGQDGPPVDPSGLPARDEESEGPTPEGQPEDEEMEGPEADAAPTPGAAAPATPRATGPTTTPMDTETSSTGNSASSLHAPPASSSAPSGTTGASSASSHAPPAPSGTVTRPSMTSETTFRRPMSNDPVEGRSEKRARREAYTMVQEISRTARAAATA